MHYTGIDYHKRYSVLCTVDQSGAVVREARIEPNDPAVFAAYFHEIGPASKAVMEACWNWGWLYDYLCEIEDLDEVVLSHPGKTRLIAEAQIKTDKLDAHILAQLLRSQLIACAHAPTPPVRSRKHLLRQRMAFVRWRTMLRNRVHALLDRQRDLRRPAVQNIFGSGGKKWLRTLKLPTPDDALLRELMTCVDQLDLQVKELEERIAGDNDADPNVQSLVSLPGVGPILGAVMATEIDGIDRFPTADKLCSYAGLAPSVRASGGKARYGSLLTCCNKWLRWAFLEASWLAIARSGYFGSMYRRHRARGKKPTVAVTIVARRMCRIAWRLLREHREFSETIVQLEPLSPAAPDKN